jgi:hypothetical protein
MPSIASMVLDHYNGVKPITADDSIPFPPAPSPRKPKRQPSPPIAMTEGMLKNKEMLRNTLHVGIWTLEFTKIDGTPAVMECTLDPKHLPPIDPTKISVCTLDPKHLPPIDPTKISVSPRSEVAEHLLHVYSTDRQGWRSFVVPNVTKIYKKVENA